MVKAAPGLMELYYDCLDPSELLEISTLTKHCRQGFQVQLYIRSICLKEMIQHQLFMHIYISQINCTELCGCFAEVNSSLPTKDKCLTSYKLNTVDYRFEKIDNAEQVVMVKVLDLSTQNCCYIMQRNEQIHN